jgi:hypothetical protein
MTVFIAYAPEDAPAAEALEVFLERRGMFVEAETGERGFRHMQRADVAVMLWSNKSLFALHRMQMERRALDAWADGRLVLVQLDHGVLPVGLRDLRVIDAKFEPQRDIAWAAVVKAIQDAMETARRIESEPGSHAEADPHAPELGQDNERASPREAQAAPPALRRRKQSTSETSMWRWLFTGVVVLGAALGAASFLAGVSWMLWAVVAGVVVLAALAAVAAVAANQARRDQNRARAPQSSPPQAQPAPSQAAPGAPGGAVFVSYARADSAQVLPVVAAIKAQGRGVWLDTEAIQAGDGWAGEIVRAIRTASRVLIMCSSDAFESDHVKREVYLADRYHRPMTPVFLDNATPPEDFEYFFATVQPLRLNDTPEADRPQALAQALAAL